MKELQSHIVSQIKKIQSEISDIDESDDEKDSESYKLLRRVKTYGKASE